MIKIDCGLDNTTVDLTVSLYKPNAPKPPDWPTGLSLVELLLSAAWPAAMPPDQPYMRAG